MAIGGSVSPGVVFSLRLVDDVAGTGWETLGLPTEMTAARQLTLFAPAAGNAENQWVASGINTENYLDKKDPIKAKDFNGQARFDTARLASGGFGSAYLASEGSIRFDGKLDIALDHQLRLDATPDGAWGERFTLIGRFRQPLLDLHAGRWQSWDGQLYASVPRVEAAPWAQLLDASERWGVSAVDGRAALRVWAEIRHGVPVEATADVALGDATATLAPGLPPLALAQLRTRLVWRALDGGLQTEDS